MNQRTTPSILARPILAFILIFLLTALACNMPVYPQEITTGPDLTKTEAALEIATTVATITGGQNATPPPDAPRTPEPAASATAIIPAPTLRPSATSGPAPTNPPAPTATPQCDQAAFIMDVNIPDGTTLTSGTQFTKTWRLQNKGTCTWTPDYAVVFDSGSAMEGPSAQKIGVSVTPGGTVDVSVPLKAPGAPGNYKGYWKLRNAANVIFGIGPNRDSFYVEINVVAPSTSTAGFDFVGNVCAAQWSGNGKSIPCRDRSDDPDGFVQTLKNPMLENNYVDDEPALLTYPPRIDNGVISGKYPAYTVQPGDHFLAIVSCENNAKNCNVRFQLDYQLDSGALQTLASWNETHNGSFTNVDVDLSSLAGKTVQFILTVSANGAPDQDRALWLLPRIEKK